MFKYSICYNSTMKFYYIHLAKNGYGQDLVFLICNSRLRSNISYRFGMFFVKNQGRKTLRNTYFKDQYLNNLIPFSFKEEGKAYEECFYYLFGEKVLFPKKVYDSSDNVDMFNYALRVIKKEMRKFIESLMVKYSRILNFDLTTIPIKITTMTGAFGKYTINVKNKQGHFSFSVFIGCLNKGTIESVVAHEICHIFHFDHGKEFYNLLYKIFPNYDYYYKLVREYKVTDDD